MDLSSISRYQSTPDPDVWQCDCDGGMRYRDMEPDMWRSWIVDSVGKSTLPEEGTTFKHKGIVPESQSQNQALTPLYVPYSLPQNEHGHVTVLDEQSSTSIAQC